jgi:hypothetical protein
VHSVRLSCKFSKLGSSSCSMIRRSPRLSKRPLHEIASCATAPTRCAAPIRVLHLERVGALVGPSKRPASSSRSSGQGEDQRAHSFRWRLCIPGILLIGGEDWVACLEPHSSTQLAMRLRLVIPLVRPSRLPVVYFGAASV